MRPTCPTSHTRTTNAMDKDKQFIAGLTQAWRDEMRSAKNYHALARRESNLEKRSILVRMAEAEERHAERSAKRLHELGADPGKYTESFVDRARRWILLKSDTTVAARMLEAGESEADKLYDLLMVTAQLDFATGLDAAIVTHNRADFEHLFREYIEARKHFAGIIILRRRNVYQMAQQVAKFVFSHESIDDQLWYL